MIPINYVSHSRLEMFRKNPALYKKTYIDMIAVRESSPAMILGSLVHAMLLEPSTVEERFAVAPIVDKRTKAGKEAWDDFKKSVDEKGEGIEIVTHDDVDQANRMIAAIRENSSSQYFECPTVVKESEILSTVEFDGSPLQFKFIPDMYCPEKGFLVDLKTVSSYDPMDWAKDCVYNGYIRQMALYRFLLRSMQIPINECYHIVVDKGEYPSCMVAQFDPSDLDRAENQTFETIRKLIKAHETGVFLPEYYGVVPRISAPAWAWR